MITVHGYKSQQSTGKVNVVYTVHTIHLMCICIYSVCVYKTSVSVYNILILLPEYADIDFLLSLHFFLATPSAFAIYISVDWVICDTNTCFIAKLFLSHFVSQVNVS